MTAEVVPLYPADETAADPRVEVLAQAVRDALGPLAGRSTVDVDELCEPFGWGRSTAYDAVRRGIVPSVRVNRRVVVPVPALVALLLGLGNDQAPPAPATPSRDRGGTRDASLSLRRRVARPR